MTVTLFIYQHDLTKYIATVVRSTSWKGHICTEPFPHTRAGSEMHGGAFEPLRGFSG